MRDRTNKAQLITDIPAEGRAAPDLADSLQLLDRFRMDGLAATVARIERQIEGTAHAHNHTYLDNADQLFLAALAVKAAAAQIDNIVHAAGVLTLLPKILEHGEQIAELCLAAGTGGRKFDLRTNRRIAEFKFMRFRASRNSKRLEGAFGDYLKLAEAINAPARRELWLLDPTAFNKFLKSRSNFTRWATLANPPIASDLHRTSHGWQTVADYARDRGSRVTIHAIAPLVPQPASNDEQSELD